MFSSLPSFLFFFFNDTATTEIYTLSLHDALPICQHKAFGQLHGHVLERVHGDVGASFFQRHFQLLDEQALDRKSTRLNSSHLVISYAVFCLKKKKKDDQCKQIERSTTRLTRAHSP